MKRNDPAPDAEVATVNAFDLSYQENVMSLDSSGKILTKDAKALLREQHGYCMTCPGVPVLLYQIKRSRLNPLWSSRKPRTAEGECTNGVCLRCENPNSQAPQPTPAPRRKSTKHLENISRESSETSTTSSISSFSGRQSPHRQGSQKSGLSGSNHLSTSRAGGSSHRSLSTRRQSHSGTDLVAARLKSIGSSNRSLQTDRPMSRGRRGSSRNLAIGDHLRQTSGRGRSRTSSDSVDSSFSGGNRSRGNSSYHDDTSSPVNHGRDALGISSCHSRSGQQSMHNSYGDQGLFHSSHHSYRGGTLDSSFANLDLNDSCHSHRSSSIAPDVSAPTPRNRNGPMDRSSGSRNGSRRHLMNRGSSNQSLMSILSNEGSDASSHKRAPSHPTTPNSNTAKPSVSSSDANVEEIMQGLEGLFVDMKATGDASLITDVLVSSMDSQTRVAAVQVLCIRTLADLFVDTNLDANPVIVANGHGRILRAMGAFPTNTAVQVQACRALATLAGRENTRVSLIRSGVCESIDKTLVRYFGEERVAENAIQVLRSLSFEREGANALVRLEMPNKVMEVMHCNLRVASVQRDGCALLSNLAVDVERQAVSVVPKGILSVIVAGMKEHQEDPSVLVSACFALKNLTYEESNLRSLARVVSCQDVLVVASRVDPAAEDASLVLDRVKLCIAEDASLEEQICASLDSLPISDDPEVVTNVLETLQNYSWSERTTKACLAILQELVGSSEEQKRTLLRPENFELMEYVAECPDFCDSVRRQMERLIGIVST